MNKKLLKQIVNERRSNSWLFIELLLVSIVLWYVVDYMFVTLYTYFEPRGFDIENTYRVEFDYLTEKSPDYIANRTDEEAHADMRELLDRLRRRPGVEAVSMSQNSFPYNGSNSGMDVRLDTMESKYNIRRWVTPDFFRVFRYQGANGETPEQLAALLKEGTFMVSRNVFESRYKIDLKDYVGKEFCPNWWQRSKWSVMMIFPPVLIAGPQSSCYRRIGWLRAMKSVCVRTKTNLPLLPNN